MHSVNTFDPFECPVDKGSKYMSYYVFCCRPTVCVPEERVGKINAGDMSNMPGYRPRQRTVAAGQSTLSLREGSQGPECSFPGRFSLLQTSFPVKLICSQPNGDRYTRRYAS